MKIAPAVLDIYNELFFLYILISVQVRKNQLMWVFQERTTLPALKLAFCKSAVLTCSTDGMYFHSIRKYFKVNQSSIDGFL